MLQKVFENILDVELYCQMVDLIIRLSSVQHKDPIYRRMEYSALFFHRLDHSMEETYALHYPGEVLERLSEKTEVGEKQLRALGLALAETRRFQNIGMFVGKQEISFWKKFNRILSKNDIYRMGILYLYEDKAKEELYEKMRNFPLHGLQELLFVFNIFEEDDEFWESRKHDLNRLLGEERKFSVYEYKEVYVWLTEHLTYRLKNYHKKDVEVLKYLFRLPYGYAKEGSTARKKLMASGYSEREIMFLNMTLLLQCDLSQKIKITGLTAERMATETCLLFFDGEHYPQEAYALCQKLLEVYHHFSVRLKDETGILDYLYSRLEVQNIRTYQILYERDQSKEGHRKWFLIDLTDQKWHGLQQIMKADEFEDWVLKTLEEKNYTSEELKQYLSIYTALTGEEITKIFWKCNKYSLHFLFSRFVEWGYLHPKDLLEQYLRDSETPGREVREKWFHMVYYLQQYVKGLRSQEAYDLLMMLIARFGISNQSSMFEIEKILWDSLGIQARWSQKKLSFQSLDFIRPFLSVEEHQELFRILEQYIFHDYTESYVDFLAQFLQDSNNFLWFPKEEAKKIFFYLQPLLTSKTDVICLRQIYLTEQELHELEEENKKRELRHQEYKKLKKREAIRKDFTSLIAKKNDTDQLFHMLQKYLSGHYYSSEETKERRYITKKFICAFFARKQKKCFRKEEIQDLLEVLQILLKESVLELGELKLIIQNVELEKEGLQYEAA